MTNRAIILGSGSDIGAVIRERLMRDGWHVDSFDHQQELWRSDWWDWGVAARPEWDLVVCCYGVLDPIGSFWEIEATPWENSLYANALLPLRQVRALYPYHRPGASVCFFSGAGTSGPAPTYSAYAASKVMLVKITELLDDESPDIKFFVLGPGVVRTKIHEQTLRAGDRAANAERVQDFVARCEPGTSMDDIYECLMACHAAPKAAIGGRNIYVPSDDWENLSVLANFPSAFKLRRSCDNDLRRYGIDGKSKWLLCVDGSRRLFTERDMQRMRLPKTDDDWALRLSVKKSQRPWLEMDRLVTPR